MGKMDVLPITTLPFPFRERANKCYAFRPRLQRFGKQKKLTLYTYIWYIQYIHSAHIWVIWNTSSESHAWPTFLCVELNKYFSHKHGFFELISHAQKHFS